MKKITLFRDSNLAESIDFYVDKLLMNKLEKKLSLEINSCLCLLLIREN